jgi:putative ABC transport system permease protein
VFLAWRELTFARVRFLLMGAVVALISVLVILLSGLSTGLVNDGVSGLQRMPADAFAFAAGTKTDSAFTRSTVELGQVDTWKAQAGVTDATALGTSLVNTAGPRGPVDLALFGVVPGSFVAPSVASGDSVGADNGIVVGSTAGLDVGDVLTIDRLGTELTVVGIAPGQRTFGHVDIAYTPLPSWQRIHAGVAEGEALPSRARTEASVVALRTAPGADLTAGDAAAATTSRSRTAAYHASPGFTAETGTMTLIQVFLYAIAALVVGAFFTVWTIQRRGELAVLRAMGASTRFLLTDSLLQAAVVLVGATLAGTALGVAAGQLLGNGSAPFALEAAPVATAAALVIGLGLAGAGVAVLRIVRTDPLTALGGAR